MKRNTILFLLIISLLLTACGRGSSRPSEGLTVMCYPYEADVLFALDPNSVKPNCITAYGDDGISKEDWTDQLYADLMAKTGDVDMYVLCSNNTNAYKIIRDHYYVDLSQDESMKEYFNAMDLLIRDWSTQDGEIFGFPTQISFSMIVWADTSQIKAIGYEIGDIGTIDGLLGFCEEWDTANLGPAFDGAKIPGATAAHLLRSQQYYINYIYNHYDRADGSLDIDTPVFRRLVEQCRELYLHEEIFGGDLEGALVVDQILDTHAPLYLNCFHLLPSNNSYQPVVYPRIPGEDPDTGRYCRIYWLIVNPASRHIPETLEHMALFARHAREKKIPYLFSQEGFCPGVPVEKIDNIRDFLEENYVGYGFPGCQDVIALCDEYVYEGTKTLDEVIEESQRILDMMQREQYIGQ